MFLDQFGVSARGRSKGLGESVNFGRRCTELLVENLEKLAGTGPKRVVPNVERENAGAFEGAKFVFR